MKAAKLEGKRFGKLLVIRDSGQRSGTAIKWECKCDCGAITYTKTSSLRNGTTSCGCKRKDRLDKNLIGKKFNYLTVLGRGSRHGNQYKWIVKCDCGVVKEVFQQSLMKGDTKSCGCRWKDQYPDYSGKRVGRLLVLKKLEERSGKSLTHMYLCRCDCGNTTKVSSSNLTSNHIRSCGCMKYTEESRRKFSLAHTKHGHWNKGKLTPTYRTWMSMKKRCNYTKGDNYHLYGSRGITV